jgi:hypothetical protein
MAILFFAANIIAIGLTLYMMRRYIKMSHTIKTERTNSVIDRHGYTRILFPVITAVLACVISFWSTRLSLTFLTLGMLFNLLPHSTSYFYRALRVEE